MRPTLTITTLALESGEVGTPYLARLEAAGGAPPLRWTCAPLPNGLSLDAASGALTGIPKGAAVQTILVTAKDSADPPANAHKYLTMRIAVGPLVIRPASLPPYARKAAYACPLEASGGVPPYSWAVTSGSLPPGLALGPGGLISGTTAEPGPFAFTVTLKDRARAKADRAFTLAAVATPLTWTASANFSQDYLGIRVAATAGRIVVVQNRAVGSISSISNDGSSFMPVPGLPEDIPQACALVASPTAAWFGGRADAKDSFRLLTLDGDFAAWRSIAPAGAPQVGWDCFGTWFDEQLWLIGGNLRGDELTAPVWSSRDGRDWTRHPDAPFPSRGGAACAAFNGRIWMVGGVTGIHQPVPNDLWTTGDGANWTREADVPWAGGSFNALAAAVVAERLCVLVGPAPLSGPSLSVWTMTAAGEWSELPAPEGVGQSGAWPVGACSFGARLLLAANRPASTLWQSSALGP